MAIPSRRSGDTDERGFAAVEVQAPGATHRATAAYHSTPVHPSERELGFNDAEAPLNVALTTPDTARQPVAEPAVAGEEADFSALPEHTKPEAGDLSSYDAEAEKPSSEERPSVDVDASSDVSFDELPEVQNEAPRELPEELKLRAPPGLTYNFHTLDALIGWVGSKDTSAMEISLQGDEWRSFAVFLSAIRAGMDGWQAWDAALDSEAPSAMDEILRIDAAGTPAAVVTPPPAAPALSGTMPAQPTPPRRAAQTTVIQQEIPEQRSALGPPEKPEPSEPIKRRSSPAVSASAPASDSSSSKLAWVVGALLAIGGGVAGALWYLGKL